MKCVPIEEIIENKYNTYLYVNLVGAPLDLKDDAKFKVVTMVEYTTIYDGDKSYYIFSFVFEGGAVLRRRGNYGEFWGLRRII